MDLVPAEVIQGKILIVRGRKVMLDRDLAELYGVETVPAAVEEAEMVKDFSSTEREL